MFFKRIKSSNFNINKKEISNSNNLWKNNTNILINNKKKAIIKLNSLKKYLNKVNSLKKIKNQTTNSFNKEYEYLINKKSDYLFYKNLSNYERKIIEHKTENAFFIKSTIEKIFKKTESEIKNDIRNKNNIKEKFNQYYPVEVKNGKQLSPYKNNKKNITLKEILSKHYRKPYLNKKIKLKLGKIKSERKYSDFITNINNMCNSYQSIKTNTYFNKTIKNIEYDYKKIYTNLKNCIE